MAIYQDSGQRSAGGAPWSMTAVAGTETKFLEGRVPPVGTRMAYNDGRVFYMAKAGETLAAGNLVVAAPNTAAIIAGEFGVDGATAPVAGEGGAIGDTTIRLSDAITGQTAGEYAGGYLSITDGTGEDYMYKIKTNEASNATNGHLVTIFDGLVVALDNTSVGSMIANLFDGVIVSNAANPMAEFVVGRAMVVAAADDYIWVQTWGPCLFKSGAAVIQAGQPVQAAEDDDGSACELVYADAGQVIGAGIVDGTDLISSEGFLSIFP